MRVKTGQNLDHVHEQLEQALDKVVKEEEKESFKISGVRSTYVVSVGHQAIRSLLKE